MTAWRAAVQEYVALRRSLGFLLHDAEKGLLAFATYLEQQGATTITTAAALTWAHQPTGVQPAEWARRLSHIRGFARQAGVRSADGGPADRLAAVSPETRAPLSVLGRRDPRAPRRGAASPGSG